MRMQGKASQRSAGGAGSDSGGGLRLGLGKLMASLALCLMAAGCASIGQALGPSGLGSSASNRDVSIAFESIDGLPRDLSQKLVRDLDEEAAALRIAVAPPGGEAAYRVRAYLAAHPRGATTSIAWAWDVYDAGLQRAVRLSGEEEAGPSAGHAPARKGSEERGWTAADEAVLRRIARTGMLQLVDFMASTPPAPAAPTAPAPAAPAPTRNGSDTVASIDDVATAPAGAIGAPEPGGVPLPPRRPVLAAMSGTTRLADATAGR
jgi:hypothetical protein